MQPAVIALVILFQPELRSALEQSGRIGPARGETGSGMLHTLVEAADLLSTNRIGALVAIEGRTGLSHLSGVPTCRLDHPPKRERPSP